MNTQENAQVSTQERIAQASMACLALNGFEKVTLNDIAKLAGVSRPTVYSYFKDSNEVLQYALLQSAYRFSEEIILHLKKFNGVSERVLEAMLFCLKRLPDEPALALISSPEIAKLVNEYALSSIEGNEICKKIFSVIYQDHLISKQDLNDVMEICIRFLLSLLTVKSAKKRSIKQQREFLKKHLLPMVNI